MKYKLIIYYMCLSVYYMNAMEKEQELVPLPNKMGYKPGRGSKGSYGSLGSLGVIKNITNTLTTEKKETPIDLEENEEKSSNPSLEELINKYHDSQEMTADLLQKIIDVSQLVNEENIKKIVALHKRPINKLHMPSTRTLLQLLWLSGRMKDCKSDNMRNGLILKKIGPYLPVKELQISKNTVQVSEKTPYLPRWVILAIDEGIIIMDISYTVGAHVNLKLQSGTPEIFADDVAENGGVLNCDFENNYKVSKPNDQLKKKGNIITQKDDTGVYTIQPVRTDNGEGYVFVRGDKDKKETYSKLHYHTATREGNTIPARGTIFLNFDLEIPGTKRAVMRKRVNMCNPSKIQHNPMEIVKCIESEWGIPLEDKQQSSKCIFIVRERKVNRALLISQCEAELDPTKKMLLSQYIEKMNDIELEQLPQYAVRLDTSDNEEQESQYGNKKPNPISQQLRVQYSYQENRVTVTVPTDYWFDYNEEFESLNSES